ncbi:MAG: hypothetical protein HKM28_01250 [Flavobacteriaceae bacterium]|nr:hypothetical protein [Flavobacteriaceae bacterium]
MKNIIILLVLCGLLSCNQTSRSVADPSQLNGYWEIDGVTKKDGTMRDFTISTTVDFIEVKDSMGVRKKVNPKLDGSFTTSTDFETFVVTTHNDSIRLKYQTPFNQWDEVLLSTTDSTFTTMNEEGNIYHYKRFAPFNFTSK